VRRPWRRSVLRAENDIVWIAIVIAVAVVVLVRANGCALDPIIDTGRDLYIPEQIRGGGVKLYRDILYYYPPLAPYLLALITAMTGSSLAAYTMIGAAIGLLFPSIMTMPLDVAAQLCATAQARARRFDRGLQAHARNR